MTEMTPDTIRHLAGLARIALSDEEINRLTGELSAIVNAVEAVQTVASDDIPPTSHPIPLGNVFRTDVVGPTLTPEDALRGAPDHDGSRFRVTAILGEEL
jgi:aspartyl-tRNA(Asn)/glutamyl-tRNA(Gln) amidotransferase subunit C